MQLLTALLSLRKSVGIGAQCWCTPSYFFVVTKALSVVGLFYEFPLEKDEQDDTN